MKKLLILLPLVLAACGGGGTSSDNPPDISGSWHCSQNCSGSCTVADSVSITQNGDQIAISSGGSTTTGSIDNDGNFNTDGINSVGISYNCEGQVVDDLLTVRCTVSDGTTCQQVTYER